MSIQSSLAEIRDRQATVYSKSAGAPDLRHFQQITDTTHILL